MSEYPHHSSNLVPPVFRPQCTSSCHHSVPFLSSLQADASVEDASGESQPLTFSPPPEFRPRLKLPVQARDWEAANQYFSEVLVPLVLAEVSVENKNRVFMDGIYGYFSSHLGVCSSSPSDFKSSSTTDQRQQIKARENSARRKLRQAKQLGDHSPEQINNFAVNFLNLVRLHSICIYEVF